MHPLCSKSSLTYALLGAASLFALGLHSQAQTESVYNGNGATGFGGSVGNSTLTISSTTTAINFSLATSGLSGNVLAIYIDSVAGGANSTVDYTDTADSLRTALSGTGGNGRTVANFSSGFGADYGISLQPGSFAGLFNLSTPANFAFVADAGLDTSASTLLKFSVTRAALGLSATGGFSFVASLISTSAYRANETIGTSATVPGTTGDTPNAGFTGTQAFAAANVYAAAAVPEPSTYAMLLGGAGVLALVQTRRRRAALIK